MSSNSQFANDTKAGNKGETIVYSWLLRQPKIKNVLDVSDDIEFQKEDVDFLVLLSNKQVCKVEVKTDFKANETGNIPFETISTQYLNSKGCCEKTKADKIFYYIYNTNDLFIADVKKVRNYINENKDKLKEVNMGDGAKGYLLKINELSDLKILTKFNKII